MNRWREKRKKSRSRIKAKRGILEGGGGWGIQTCFLKGSVIMGGKCQQALGV